MSDIMMKMLKFGKILFAGIIAFSIVLPLFLFPHYVFAGSVPDTGQTKCYDNVGEIPCPQPGEPFYGQDGCYTINPPSYTKLDAQGNDLPDSATSWVMVRDNVTGLIWEVKTDDGSINDRDNRYTWKYAQDTFIADLNASSFCGYSEWRLPTIKELSSIVSSGTFMPAINTGYFPNIVKYHYWSSTIDAGDSGYALTVEFGSGVVIHSPTKRNNFVRAVRGKQSSNTFIDNGDGTVTDSFAGLMWQQETAGAMTWEGAISYCENLSLAGYDDWRLPSRNGLHSLVDYNKYSPSIDTAFFPDTVLSMYWSSTTDLGNTSCAEVVDFGCPSIGGATKSSSYSHYARYVRAVRGGQSKSFDNLIFPLSGTLEDRTINLAFGADWPDGECGGLVKKNMPGLISRL